MAQKEKVYDSGRSPTALKQGAATYRHVFFALRYVICIRKHARFLLPFCVGTITTQKTGTAVKESNSVRHISLSNLDRVISYIDSCIHVLPQSMANAGIKITSLLVFSNSSVIPPFDALRTTVS